MKYMKGVFWGAITGVDSLVILLLVTLYFNNPSVLYMLMDATYSVWYFVGVGAILGASFMYSNLGRKTYKLKSPARGGGMYSETEYYAPPPMSIGMEGKK